MNALPTLSKRRHYRPSGLYITGLTPDEQAAMTEVRTALIEQCGGDDAVSYARRILIDLAAGAAVRCMRINAYIASMTSLVDRRHRREWTIVSDARRGEQHLQGLLRDIGLDPRTKPTVDIAALCAAEVAKRPQTPAAAADESARPRRCP
jgi:hypothetical protein